MKQGCLHRECDSSRQGSCNIISQSLKRRFPEPPDAACSNKAVRAALRGPDTKHQKINGHEFNVKPVIVTGDTHGVLHINGGRGHHRSHDKSPFNDYQVYYEVINDSTNDNSGDPNSKPAVRVDRDIDSGGFINTVADDVKIVYEFRKSNPDLCKQAATTVATGKFDESEPFGKYRTVIEHNQVLLGEDWKDSASFSISCIAYLVVAEARSSLIVVS